MIGILHAGVKRFERERRSHYVSRYGLSINNAGDLHTGERAEGRAIQYSAIYLPPRVLVAIGLSGDFMFADAVIKDLEVWGHLARAAASSYDNLLFEEAVSEGLLTAAERYGRGQNSRSAEQGSAPLAKVIEAIHAHYSEPIGLVDLANVAGVSVRHLIRSFKRHLGTTPHRHLTSIRIQKAREQLQCGASLAETAVASGFADQAHLSHVFRAVMGTTPRSYQLGVGARVVSAV